MHTNWGVTGGPKESGEAFRMAWGPGVIGVPAVIFDKMSRTIGANEMSAKKVMYASLALLWEISSRTRSRVERRLFRITES